MTIDSEEFQERIQRLCRLGSTYSTRGKAAYRALVAEIDNRIAEASKDPQAIENEGHRTEDPKL